MTTSANASQKNPRFSIEDNEHVNQFLKELTLEKLLFEDIEENKIEIYQSKMAQMPDMENSHE